MPVLLTPAECERAVLALRIGSLSTALRNPADRDRYQDYRPATRQVLLYGEKRGCPHTDRYSTIEKIKIIRGLPGLEPKPRPRARPRPRRRPSAPVR